MHIVIPADILAQVALVFTTGALLLAFGVGAVLGYHWYRFGLSPLATVGTLGLYAAGTVLLVVILYTTGSHIVL